MQSLMFLGCFVKSYRRKTFGGSARPPFGKERVNYFFGVNLGEKLFSMTDNLSLTLQQTRMSAVQGQRLTELTKQTIQKMRADDDFEDFLCLVKKKADSLQTEIFEPSLPRRRKAPKCFEI